MDIVEEPSDRDRFLSIVDKLLAVECVHGFMRCLKEDLRAVLPFGCMVGGWGKVTDGHLVPEVILNADFPAEYLESIKGLASTVRSPILAQWLTTRIPLSFEFDRACDQLSSEALRQARQFDLANVLAHGHYVPSDGSLTYFSFHRLLGPITRQHRLLIARLMPHLHCTANRIGYQAIPTDPVAAQEPTDLALLSPRQREIMRWLICGKTNWEIGQITGTSEANVKYHLSNLMRSHAVSSRASLVFKLCKPAGSDARQTV